MVVGEGVGEIDMQPGKTVGGHVGHHAVEKFAGRPIVHRQQSGAAHRREGYRRQQLGVVADAGALAGICPGPIEHVLAVGMALEVGRQRGVQLTAHAQQDMVRRVPATTAANAAALLQGGKECMAQERLLVRQQGIPLLRVEIGKTGKGLDRHGASLARAAKEEKQEKKWATEVARGALRACEPGGLNAACVCASPSR
ncbi:hypothetical protein D3C76_1316700 [compost metagenome]